MPYYDQNGCVVDELVVQECLVVMANDVYNDSILKRARMDSYYKYNYSEMFFARTNDLNLDVEEMR